MKSELLGVAVALISLAAPLSAAPAGFTVENFHESLVANGFVLREPGWHVWCYATVLDHYLKRWPKPAKAWSAWALQRPEFLLGTDGQPTHLYAPLRHPARRPPRHRHLPFQNSAESKTLIHAG